MKKLLPHLDRLDLYVARIRRNVITERDLVSAMANAAELSEIARRLWTSLQKELNSHEKDPA